MSCAARAVIRLDAIRHNLRIIQEKAAGARVMAVVKANAYGHGLTPVARSLAEADCLAVARLKEADELRRAGIAAPITLLGGVTSEANLDKALELDLQLGVHSKRQVEWFERHDAASATVWVKVDTGMNRLGFSPEETPEMIERLRDSAAVADVKLMTHLANAEDERADTTRVQIERFSKLVEDFDGDVSVANSAGVLAWQDKLDIFSGKRAHGRHWVRPGLALYGISPFADSCGADLGLRPAMRFESQLIAEKAVRKGEAVGYGGTWRAPRDTVLGIIAVGYGDGYTRFIPTGCPVVVNDRRAPVAGLVSMDLTAVDLGPGATDRPGDRVLLWGDELPVEEVAKTAATIPYQLVCGVTDRVDRSFEN